MVVVEEAAFEPCVEMVEESASARQRGAPGRDAGPGMEAQAQERDPG